MATALFLLGLAGAGKTQTAKRWVRARLRKGEPWVLLDKDSVGAVLGPALMRALGLDPDDRDSPEYREKVRDLEYEACLSMAREQLALGFNVVLPGPWGSELSSGRLFDVEALGFPLNTKLTHVYLDITESVMHRRITRRGDPRDAWKLKHWDQYALRIVQPSAIQSNQVPVVSCNLTRSAQLSLLASLVEPAL